MEKPDQVFWGTGMPPIRRLGIADLSASMALAASRGWNVEDRTWSLLLEIGEVYGVDDPTGGLAGTITMVRYNDAIATIGMMLVAAQRARQGLGLALFRHVVDQATDATLILYATGDGKRIYEKVGCLGVGQVPALIGRFRQDPDGLAEQTRPVVESDLDRIIQVDAAAFGAGRAPVLRRLFTLAERIRVVEADGRITGYAVASRDGSFAVIGPVVAPNIVAAQALIVGLATATDGLMRLDLHNQDLADWCRARGLWQVTSTTFMVRGNWPLAGDRDRLYAPASLAVG